MSKILVIGGTRFMGYFAVESALARGHTVTLFNRGKSSPEAFPSVEKIVGDRDTNLDLLRGRHWDAVIDTCGFVPRVVHATAELLRDAIDQYIFISSRSVYADTSQPLDETGAVATLTDPTTEDVTGETYGGLKALCEQAVEAVLPGRVLNDRSGLIVGPRDSSFRFDYWVHRIAQGGEVLAPATPDRLVQFIDARDQAEWLIRMVESRGVGIYNVLGPAQSLTMGELFETCKAVTGSDAIFTWVDEPFLLERNVAPWQELPLWVPADMAGFHNTRIDRALAAGLSFRPIAETVRGSLDWLNAHPQIAQNATQTLSAERERALLSEWHART